jgi:hypothetical protein
MLGKAIDVEKLAHAPCELNAKAHEAEKVSSSSASLETSNQSSSPSVEEKVIEQVNICEYPEGVIQTPQIGEEYSIGDLHSNPVSFLQFLTRQGIATISKEDFNCLVEIYNKYDLLDNQHKGKNEINAFKNLLTHIKFNKEALVRLIGDETADRGKNDVFILLIEKALIDAGVKLEVLASNHGFEFIQADEKKTYTSTLNFTSIQDLDIASWSKLPRDLLQAPMLRNMLQASSLIGLNVSIEKQFKSESEWDELNALIQSHKKSIKLIGYTLSANEDEITIYSHAGIDIDVISHMAKKYGIAFDNRTAVALAQSIDKINAFIKEHLDNNTLHTLCDAKQLSSDVSDPSQFPIEFILWNRKYSVLNRDLGLYDYKVNYVHGHDSGEKSHDNIYNLDNELGKGEAYYTGQYKILCSIGHQLGLKFEDKPLAGHALSRIPVSQKAAEKEEDLLGELATLLQEPGHSNVHQENLLQTLKDGKVDKELKFIFEVERNRRIEIERESATHEHENTIYVGELSARFSDL